MRRLHPLWVLAAWGAVCSAWFRTGGSDGKPGDVIGPPPTVEAIQAAARAFAYEPGRVGGTFRSSVGSDIKELNYVLSKDNSTSTVLSHLYCELLQRDPITYAHRPYLAREVPAGPDDEAGLVWTFHLREDVRWFDGKPLTAEDVVFSFERLYFNEAVAYSGREALRLETTDPVTGERKTAFAKVEATGRFSVRFTLPRKWGFFMDNIPYRSILPKHVLARSVDEGTFNQVWPISADPATVIGCGPFKLERVVQGERYVLVRNPDYFETDEFGNRLPYLERIVYRVVPSGETTRNMFRLGELDAIGVSGRYYHLYTPLAREGKIRIVRRGPSLGSRFLVFNLNVRNGPDGKPYVDPAKSRWFRTKEFRQAVSHAIDRDAIRDLIFGNMAYLQASPVSEAIDYYYHEGVRRYPHDLDAARRLLDAAGFVDTDGDGIREFPPGRPIRFTVASYADSPEYERIALILREDLRKIGIDLTYQKVQFNALVRQLSESWNWEAIIIGFTGGWEPHAVRSMWSLGGLYHLWNPMLEPDDPGIFDWERRIDRIFDEVSYLDTVEARRSASREWQELVAENLPVIYTVTEENIFAIQNRFGNFNPTIYLGYDIRRLFERETETR